jgi:hypothetical protein
MPQVFVIVSARGLEIGLAATIHPADFSQQGIKERVRDAAPAVLASFPAPGSPAAAALDDGLRRIHGPWFFRRKTRLDPGVADFPSLDAWLDFLKSAEGGRWAGGSISRYLRPEELEGPGVDLEAVVREAAAVFAPLMHAVVPEGTVAGPLPIQQTVPDDDPGVTQDEAVDAPRVWLWALGEGEGHWDELYEQGQVAIGWDELGDLGRFGTLEQMAEALSGARPSDPQPMEGARACHDFVHAVRPGDLVYAKRGTRTIVGHGVIDGGYRHDPSRPALHNVRPVRWLGRGEWAAPGALPTGVLTDVSGDPVTVEMLSALVAASGAEALRPVAAAERRPYSVDQAMEGLFMPRSEFERVVEVWRAKRNLILQGAPGVGKSFVARRLAYALMGHEDPSRVRTVQFHQSYAYEDFVQGFRPDGKGGFALREGVFLEFCRRALNDQGEDYVFVIDEINRGNLSKILGELMLLIEPDKRSPEWAVKLAYAEKPGERFYVPPNLFLLGLMNTADRSLAVVDYALRRRFGFVTVRPGFGEGAFSSHLGERGVTGAMVARIRARMGELNEAIAADKTSLGPGFCIGHSFFASPPLVAVTAADGGAETEEAWYRRVVETEIAPLLEEYWFDAPDKAEDWRRRLLA